ALQQHSAAAVKHAQRMPERKALLSPNCELFLGCLQHTVPQPAVLMEERSEVDGMSKAEGVADFASQFAHLAINFEGLVRVTEVPQRQGEIATMSHTGIVPSVGRPELRLLKVLIASQRFIEVSAGAGKLSAVEHGHARHEERFHQHS